MLLGDIKSNWRFFCLFLFLTFLFLCGEYLKYPCWGSEDLVMFVKCSCNWNYNWTIYNVILLAGYFYFQTVLRIAKNPRYSLFNVTLKAAVDHGKRRLSLTAFPALQCLASILIKYKLNDKKCVMRSWVYKVTLYSEVSEWSGLVWRLIRKSGHETESGQRMTEWEGADISL